MHRIICCMIMIFIYGCDDKEEVLAPDPCEIHEDCRYTDNVMCTLDLCHEGFCINIADDNECSIFHYCDGDRGCWPRDEQIPAECQTTLDCDDGIECTMDFCSGGLCYNLPNDLRCLPSFYCVSGSGCINSAMADDADRDGFFDFMDNCPDVYNPHQEDEDDDGVGDACERDLE